MKWKHLTRGAGNYFVNLENVAYIHKIQEGSKIVFGPRAYEGADQFIIVDQAPSEILGDEIS